MMLRFCLFISILFMASPCFAHKPSDSYLRLQVKGSVIEGEWAIALRDLELVVGIDSNLDGKITWGELKGRRDSAEAKLSQLLTLKNEGKVCPLQFNNLLVDEYSDGLYAVFRFSSTCTKPIENLTLSDQFLFDIDAQHKSLISLTAGDYMQSAILSTDLRQVTLSMYAPGVFTQLREYVRQGMWHIWLGFDHFFSFLPFCCLPGGYTARISAARICRLKLYSGRYSVIFLHSPSRMRSPLRSLCLTSLMCAHESSNR